MQFDYIWFQIVCKYMQFSAVHVIPWIYAVLKRIKQNKTTNCIKLHSFAYIFMSVNAVLCESMEFDSKFYVSQCSSILCSSNLYENPCSLISCGSKCLVNPSGLIPCSLILCGLIPCGSKLYANSCRAVYVVLWIYAVIKCKKLQFA